MKVLIGGDSGSLHTFRWAVQAHLAGIEIHVFSLNRNSLKEWEAYPGIHIHYPKDNIGTDLMKSDTGLQKWRYLKAIKDIKLFINQIHPDALHAHYASSYGLLFRLSGFRPYALSVWGSDVFDFPRRSFLHRTLLSFVLSKASVIQSTGEIMASEARKYTRRPVQVIPFGINLVQFPCKKHKSQSERSSHPVIGTVKSLENIYGVDLLIEAFALVKKEIPGAHLHITGGGSQLSFLQSLCERLGIDDSVTFFGKVSPSQVPAQISELDVFCNLSRRESFGMSILEASACGVPVVATAVDGVVETARQGVNAITVKPENSQEAANAILSIIQDEHLYNTLSEGGKNLVHSTFDEQKIRPSILDFYLNLKNQK